MKQKKEGQAAAPKKKIQLGELFENNKFVAVLSVLISVLLWFSTYLEQKPDSNTTITGVPVTINYENSMAQDLGLEIIDEVPMTVDVAVSGKRYKIITLDEEDFTAQISLASVTKAGEYTLAIQVNRNVSDPEYEIISWTPSQVSLTFDQIVTKQFPLEISTPGLSAASGYLMETPYADVDYVTVQGPQNIVNKISRCLVTIPTEKELTESLTTTGSISFLDQSGNPVESSEFKCENENLSVTIPIYKTRQLPLQVEFVNVPKGFPIEQLKYTLSRNSILVASPSETIDNLESITLGPVDFRSIDIGSEMTLDVVLNAGFKDVDNITEVTVTFPSYGLTSAMLDLQNFVLENAPSGYDIQVLTSQIQDVRIVGDSSVLEDLTSEDLVGTIDLSQYSISKGRYSVAVKIYVQGKVLAWAVGEYSADIEVTPKEPAS